MAGAWGVAGGLAVVEVCSPLLLLCWLCCWPDDSSDSSSGQLPAKPVVARDASGAQRRSLDLFSRRFASSAVSLHLPVPSTSGSKQPLSSHRSHEEIRSRRKSHLEVGDDGRYHSAPSVIDEVLHRRDWERSTRDLYIPLKLGDEESPASPDAKGDSGAGGLGAERTCKKHHKNIKSSRNKGINKELLNEDIKDYDATENLPSFYIGEASGCDGSFREDNDLYEEGRTPRAKEAKQSLNESIRSQDRRNQIVVTEFLEPAAAALDPDRSGATHHSVESRSSLFHAHPAPVPPPSVEAVGYDSDASYLTDDDVVGAWRVDAARARAVDATGALWVRARHASAGDVLAPTRRPHSAALSESELDFELEGCDELPPDYDSLLAHDHKETAI